MWLFSLLIVFSFAVPFSLSFERHLKFYKRWKVIIPAILIVYCFYIAMDILFAQFKIWNFNSNYHLNFLLFKIPIEEWLFFFVIPYSSLFVHDAIHCCLPNFRIRREFSKAINFILVVVLIPVFLINLDRVYTASVIGLAILSLFWAMFFKRNVIGRYFATYLLMLIPFIVIYSVLTGVYISNEVVWYNEDSILGYRFWTIPVEDFIYLFSFVLFTLLTRQSLIEHNFLSSKSLNNEVEDEHMDANQRWGKMIF